MCGYGAGVSGIGWRLVCCDGWIIGDLVARVNHQPMLYIVKLSPVFHMKHARRLRARVHARLRARACLRARLRAPACTRAGACTRVPAHARVGVGANARAEIVY